MQEGPDASSQDSRAIVQELEYHSYHAKESIAKKWSLAACKLPRSRGHCQSSVRQLQADRSHLQVSQLKLLKFTPDLCQ